MNKTIDESILEKKRKRCVGLAVCFNTYFYAVSGNDDVSQVNKIAKEIEKMIGSKSLICRCRLEDTFSALKYFDYTEPQTLFYHPNLPVYLDNSNYKKIEDYIYEVLAIKGNIHWTFPEMATNPFSYLDFIKMNSDFNMRFFSCVERKIIGKLLTYAKPEIIVHYRPCYLCIPVLTTATYYDDEQQQIHRIEITKLGFDCFNIKQLF